MEFGNWYEGNYYECHDEKLTLIKSSGRKQYGIKWNSEIIKPNDNLELFKLGKEVLKFRVLRRCTHRENQHITGYKFTKRLNMKSKRWARYKTIDF